MLPSEQTATHCTVRIDGDITVYTVKEFFDSILNNLNAHKSVLINLSKAGEIDNSGVQSMVVLKKYADQVNKDLKIYAPTSTMTSVLNGFLSSETIPSDSSPALNS